MHFPQKKKKFKKNFHPKLNIKMEHYVWQSTETKSGAAFMKTKPPGHTNFEKCSLILILESRILLPGSYAFQYKPSGNE